MKQKVITYGQKKKIKQLEKDSGLIFQGITRAEAGKFIKKAQFICNPSRLNQGIVIGKGGV